MYMNTAYLGKPSEDIQDTTKPLLVTAAGHYKIETKEISTTDRPHGRKDYQLIYVASGSVHFKFSGKEHMLSSGNMILFKPNDVQFYTLYLKERPETFWVHFTGYDVNEILSHYALLHSDNFFYVGKSPDYPWLFQKMIRELQLKRSNYDELINMLLHHIFLLMNRYLKDGEGVGSQLLDEIEGAAHYFNDNYNKNISVKEYAKGRLMSPCWFIGSFKKIMKSTPVQYILSLRIANAIHLLEETDLNVSEVSQAVGYEDAKYFSRVFKKHIGISPRDYKRLKKADLGKVF